MKTKFLLVLLAIALTVSCKNERSGTTIVNPDNVSYTPRPSNGLDLKLVGYLFQSEEVIDAQSFQRELNKPGGINNLDLDRDGKVDFIYVTENKGWSSSRSFDLHTKSSSGVPTFIATIKVDKGYDGKYNIHIAGSDRLYDYRDRNHNTSFAPTVGQMLFYSWLFSNSRPRYVNNYYSNGRYPDYYRSRPAVNNNSYRNRTTKYNTRSNFNSTTSSSSKHSSSKKKSTTYVNPKYDKSKKKSTTTYVNPKYDKSKKKSTTYVNPKYNKTTKSSRSKYKKTKSRTRSRSRSRRR